MGKQKGPYKVEGESLCGAKFTIGRRATSAEAFKLAEMHRHITGKRAVIYHRGKRQAY